MKKLIILIGVLLILIPCVVMANGGNSFIKGVDSGRSFLGPKKEKGKKYRWGITQNTDRFGDWFRKWMRDEIVPAGSRAHLESRGNWWSHTKDTTLLEAGLMSNGYAFTRQVCMEHGVCGDPCGDPKFSIALAGYRRYLARMRMFYEENFWTEDDWLLELAGRNQWEAEAFIGACGSINCQKLRKAIRMADKEEGILSKKHPWWKLMQWFRDRTESQIAFIFQPKTQFWKFGSRIGRVMAGLNMRTEFYEQEDEENLNYGWSNDLAYFPHRIEMQEIDGVMVPVQVPDLPEPIHKWTKSSFPKSSEWRSRCVLYGTKKWKTVMGEPKPKDRWKKTGMNYHPVTGKPINVKKGQRKYPTDEDFQAAHATWVDREQAAGRLPTDEEQAEWEKYRDEIKFIRHEYEPKKKGKK